MFSSFSRSQYLLLFGVFFFVIIFLNIFSVILIKKNHRPVFSAAEYPGRYHVSTIVVPHHNLVKDIRQKFLAEVAANRPQPKTVVLLSPDHFSTNQKMISYSDRTWNLSTGLLEFDERVGRNITKELTNNEQVVQKDHGIFNVLPEIKTYFPGAKVIPIVIGQQLPFTELAALQQNIDTFCQPAECVVIGSVDFSHYLPLHLANTHDQKTYRTLLNGELQAPQDIEVDSAQTLFLLQQHAQATQMSHFQLYQHTNSLELEGSPDEESTSHMFGWFDHELPSIAVEPQSSNKNLSKNLNLNTFTYALHLQPKNEITTLGERFFYGVDSIDTELNQPIDFSPNFSLLPQKSGKTRIVHNPSNHTLQILLGDDVAVAGTTDTQKTTVLFLPMSVKNSKHTLLRDTAKAQRIKSLFAPLTENALLKLDQQRGTITFTQPKEE